MTNQQFPFLAVSLNKPLGTSCTYDTYVHTTTQAYKTLIHKKILGYSGAHWRKLRTTFAFRVLLIAIRSIVNTNE
jgi:hypothetical protein